MEPEIILKRVDFPAPFPPIIVTNSPSETWRFKLFSATCSSGLFLLKVLFTDFILNIISPPSYPINFHPFTYIRQGESRYYH